MGRFKNAIANQRLRLRLYLLGARSKNVFSDFFSEHTAYDLIPYQSNLFAFDTSLGVKKAFYALICNGVRAAPLWDARKEAFVGMLTTTDFIQVLQRIYNSPSRKMSDLEEHRIESWREFLPDAKTLISVRPTASLYEAVEMLIRNKIHRLPVIEKESNNILFVLTLKRILNYLFQHINNLSKPRYLRKSIYKLGIGTYSDIQTARYSTTIISALNIFLEKRISFIPVVNEEMKLIDIYAKFDVLNLAAEKTYENLDIPIQVANAYRNEWFKGVHMCKKSDTLFDVIEKIVEAEVHGLVIVDDESTVLGIISISDILQFLVLNPNV